VNLDTGTFTAPGVGQSFTVAGNWTRNTTAFDPNGGAVTFDTAAVTSTIAGNTTFFNLNSYAYGKTILFTAASKQTVNGTFDFRGAP